MISKTEENAELCSYALFKVLHLLKTLEYELERERGEADLTRSSILLETVQAMLEDAIKRSDAIRDEA